MLLQLKLDEFDLVRFLEEAEERNKGIMDSAIMSIENIEDVRNAELEGMPGSVEYHISRLVDANEYVYVNFSDSALERDVNCIDGNSYYLIHEKDYGYERKYEPEEAAAHPKDVQPTQDIVLGETDSVGYLLKYENDILTIQGGLFSLYAHGFNGPCGIASATAVFPKENLELFEQPMVNYLQQYLNK